MGRRIAKSGIVIPMTLTAHKYVLFLMIARDAMYVNAILKALPESALLFVVGRLMSKSIPHIKPLCPRAHASAFYYYPYRFGHYFGSVEGSHSCVRFDDAFCLFMLVR